MSLIDRLSNQRLFTALDATWPAYGYHSVAPWCLRKGGGGGQRVTAATIAVPGTPVTASDLRRAEDTMRSFDQTPLFMIRQGEDRLDALLDKRGYAVVDPVAILAAPTSELLTGDAGHNPVIRSMRPLAIMEEIWAKGGIGPERLKIMARARTPKTYLLLRSEDRVAGVVFVSCDGDLAMLHALEVRKSQRRKGYGRYMSLAAAEWAREQGAQALALLAVRTNTAAIGLYQGLGMTEVAHYHYRKLLTG